MFSDTYMIDDQTFQFSCEDVEVRFLSRHASSLLSQSHWSCCKSVSMSTRLSADAGQALGIYQAGCWLQVVVAHMNKLPQAVNIAQAAEAQ